MFYSHGWVKVVKKNHKVLQNLEKHYIEYKEATHEV